MAQNRTRRARLHLHRGAERLQPRCEPPCEANGAKPDAKMHASADEQIRFPLSGRDRFIMRRLRGPEGTIDFRILGEAGAPAILSLIAPDRDRYADFTYNGQDADLDVSHGGLNPSVLWTAPEP